MRLMARQKLGGKWRKINGDINYYYHYGIFGFYPNANCIICMNKFLLLELCGTDYKFAYFMTVSLHVYKSINIHAFKSNRFFVCIDKILLSAMTA